MEEEDQRYLSCSAGDGQVTAVFTQVDLLDAQPRVVTVGVEAAHLAGWRTQERRTMRKQGGIGVRFFIFKNVT